MGLKYLYVGYSKTGTKSIASLFRSLGYRVHDFEESLLDTGKLWEKFLSATSYSYEKRYERIEILKDIYKNYEVATDTPSYLFWEEIMVAFPECKFIFYERDEKSWLKSFQNQMVEVFWLLGIWESVFVAWFSEQFFKKQPQPPKPQPHAS